MVWQQSALVMRSKSRAEALVASQLKVCDAFAALDTKLAMVQFADIYDSEEMISELGYVNSALKMIPKDSVFDRRFMVKADARARRDNFR